VARDAGRPRGSLGAAQVSSLFAKFTGRLFPPECFLDTSEERPEVTVDHVLRDIIGRDS
jgi:hypothetical protein